MDSSCRCLRKASRFTGAWRRRRERSGACVADDVKVGKLTSFPRSVKLKPSETVMFSWIVYRSRADRDRVNKKVMGDNRLADMMDIKELPFDAKRMVYGGFKVLVEA